MIGPNRSRQFGVGFVVALCLLSVVAVPITVSGAVDSNPESDLSLSLSSDAATVQPNGSITVSVVVSNNGEGASPAPVFDLGPLPSGWSIESWASSGATYKQSSTEWLWTELGGGSDIELDLTFSVADQTGSFEIGGTVNDGYNETATDSVSVRVETNERTGGDDGTGSTDDTTTSVPVSETPDSPEEEATSLLTNDSAIVDSVGIPEAAETVYAEQSSISGTDNGSSSATFSDGAPVSEVRLSSKLNGTVSVLGLNLSDSHYPDPPGREMSRFWLSTEANTTNTTVTFRVPIEAGTIDGSGTNVSQLQLLHRVDGEWVPVDTAVRSHRNGSIVLEAETAGLSPFSVSTIGEPSALIGEVAPVSPEETVTLDGSTSSAPYSNITSFQWRIDGRTVSGETVSVSFDEPGNYSVGLLVRSGGNRTATANTTVVVEEAATPTETTPTPTLDSTPTVSESTKTVTEQPTTESSSPGFGLFGTLVAVSGVCLLLARRHGG